MNGMTRRTRIAAVDDYGIGGLMVDRLRGLGLRALDLETSSHISVAGAEQFYLIELVDETQAEQARAALAKWGYKEYLI